jgi:hypothetical protein
VRRLIFPVLYGEEEKGGELAQMYGDNDDDDGPAHPNRTRLVTDPQFLAYKQAMPDIVPTATLQLVERVAERNGSGPLHASLRGISVRKLVLGDESAGVPVPVGEPHTSVDIPGGSARVDDAQRQLLKQLEMGLLGISAVNVDGPDDHIQLVLRHRYAFQIRNALALGE